MPVICTELKSYLDWVDSIRLLYPEIYNAEKCKLDSSDTWSDEQKNSYCNIAEQTKILKTMSLSQLKTAVVLPNMSSCGNTPATSLSLATSQPGASPSPSPSPSSVVVSPFGAGVVRASNYDSVERAPGGVSF